MRRSRIAGTLATSCLLLTAAALGATGATGLSATGLGIAEAGSQVTTAMSARQAGTLSTQPAGKPSAQPAGAVGAQPAGEPSAQPAAAPSAQQTKPAAPQQGANKTPLRIGIGAPQYDSPGGTVPAIVTVYDVPKASKVAISATGTPGSIVTCAGPVWQNPVRRTASRTCYLQLPNTPGSYQIKGSAVVTQGTVVRTVEGVGGRPVVADGVASTTPMTAADLQRIERCGNTTGNVWLTFDDGGSKAQVTSILATLKRNNVRAQFFFRGDWARKNPALFQSLTAAGHVIGNHTDSHPALSRLGKTKLVKQIGLGTAATGTPKLLRPPFGAGAFTTRLQDVARDQGYELCRWTTDTYDWDGPSAKVMAERIRYGDYRSAPVTAGGVILMHGHGKYTAPGLQQIIDTVRAKKLKLQPLK